MHNLVIQVDDDRYLIRYQLLKSVVSRKITYTNLTRTREKETLKETVLKTKTTGTRLELHPNSVLVYLYGVIPNTINAHTLLLLNNKRKINEAIYQSAIVYLGRGLSKCSEKDTFNKYRGIQYAINNADLDEKLTKDLIKELNKRYFYKLSEIYQSLAITHKIRASNITSIREDDEDCKYYKNKYTYLESFMYKDTKRLAFYIT